MQFRLVYRGSLSSQGGGGRGGSIVKEKQKIRRQFHPQLKELWQQHWHLKRQLTYEYIGDSEIMRPGGRDAEAEKIANRFKEGAFRFLPLITKTNGLACKLDILFLRRDDPGNLIRSGGGDLDNRIKVLFDALSIPQRGTMEGVSPDAEEDPLFCLLEDDCLITEVSVTTDRLLTPKEGNEHINDVVLVLSVTTKVVNANVAEMEFLA